MYECLTTDPQLLHTHVSIRLQTGHTEVESIQGTDTDKYTEQLKTK